MSRDSNVHPRQVTFGQANTPKRGSAMKCDSENDVGSGPQKKPESISSACMAEITAGPQCSATQASKSTFQVWCVRKQDEPTKTFPPRTDEFQSLEEDLG